MESRTINGRTYTRKFAWLPVRTTADELVWLDHYYIRPGRNGLGIVLTWNDLQIDLIHSKNSPTD
jgi:hypothetical protein